MQTYRNNGEIEPAPGIGKVLFEAVSHPFQKHFTNENVSEDLVRVFQRALKSRPIAQFHIFKGQRTGTGHNHENDESFEPRVFDDAVGGFSRVEHEQTGTLFDIGVEAGELVTQLVGPAVGRIHQVIVVNCRLLGRALVGRRRGGRVLVLLAAVLGLFLLLGAVGLGVARVRVARVRVVRCVAARVGLVDIFLGVGVSALDLKKNSEI